jgi:hypothetical protein
VLLGGEPPQKPHGFDRRADDELVEDRRAVWNRVAFER